jgi:hypothetical protein
MTPWIPAFAGMSGEWFNVGASTPELGPKPNRIFDIMQ